MITALLTFVAMWIMIGAFFAFCIVQAVQLNIASCFDAEQREWVLNHLAFVWTLLIIVTPITMTIAFLRGSEE